MGLGMEEAAVRRVGRYLVHRQVGAGGMASVSLAKLAGDEGFSRIVAVKQLLPQHASDEQLAATLIDEARLVSCIRHPNVVPVLDVVSAQGQVLVVMEYVFGESLSALLSAARDRGEPVDPTIAAAIAHSVLEGLHAAHEASDSGGVPLDLVHRDVSPQNVLVGVDGVARVTDFGIAKALGRLQATTEHGVAKGKATYMAPEHFRGEAVDRRTDVWAAGVILWEMLAGRTLFADQPAMFRYHLATEELAAPSTFGNASPELDRLVMRALARDPDARPATAREMAVDLEKCGHFAPARRVGQWVRRLAREKLAIREIYAQELAGFGADPSAPKSESTDLSAHVAPVPNPPRASRDGRRLLLAALALTVTVGGAATAMTRVSVRVPDRASRVLETPVEHVSFAASGAAPTAPPVIVAPSQADTSVPNAAKPLRSGRHPSLRATVGSPSSASPAPVSTSEDPGDLKSRK